MKYPQQRTDCCAVCHHESYAVLTGTQQFILEGSDTLVRPPRQRKLIAQLHSCADLR